MNEELVIPNLCRLEFRPTVPKSGMLDISNRATSLYSSKIRTYFDFDICFFLGGWTPGSVSGNTVYLNKSSEIPIDRWNQIKSLISGGWEFWDKFYIIKSTEVYNDRSYPLCGSNLCFPYTCKEQAISALGSSKYREVIIVESFDDKSRQYLLDIQEFLSESDRFKVIYNPSAPFYITLQFPDWWFEQPFYRIGWALLAARIANGRESIKDTLKENFDSFKDNPLIKGYAFWSGSRNWRHILSK